jgi:hypothetical protein
LNPAYFVDFSDENDTYTNETGALVEDLRARLEVVEIGFNEGNHTIHYDRYEVRNENNNKERHDRVFDGNYTNGEANSYRLPKGGGMDYKIVRFITQTEIGSALTRAGIDLTLDADDTAQLGLMQELVDTYWLNLGQSFDHRDYDDLSAFIATHSYDSHNDHLDGGVLYQDGGGGTTIIFAEGSSGTSGTLVEAAWDGNRLLTDAAGTWHTGRLTIEGTEYDVVVLKPTLCGYEERIFQVDTNGEVHQGGPQTKEGKIKAKVQFSPTLAEKLKEYFVNHALLDVDPDTGGSTGYIPVTEQNLTDHPVFYDVQLHEDNSTTYLDFNFTDGNLSYAQTNGDGDLEEGSGVYNFTYELDEDGAIVVDITGGEEKTFALQQVESNHWLVHEINEGGAPDPHQWFFEEPEGFRYPE